MKRKRYIFYHNKTGSKVWRIYPYQKYLELTGNHTKLIDYMKRGVDEDDIKWADVVIAQMVYDQRIVKYAKKYKKLLVYDIDDLVEDIPVNHLHFKNIRPRHKYWHLLTISKADVVLCASQFLVDRYRKFNKNIHWWGNYMDMSFWHPNNFDKIMGETRIGWAGSLSHKEDLWMIAPILGKIFKEYGDKYNLKMVHLGLGGPDTDNKLVKYFFGNDIFPEIPAERKEYVSAVSPELWPQKLASMKLDIGIAPVVDSDFARSKSTIKFLEYSVNKIAGVYSRCLYGDIVQDAYNGFTASKEWDWVSYLLFLIKNPLQRNVLAVRAYEDTVRDWDVKEKVAEWEKLILNYI